MIFCFVLYLSVIMIILTRGFPFSSNAIPIKTIGRITS
jgi:hypothetical protein